MPERERRRRRVRHIPPADSADPGGSVPETAPVHDPAPGTAPPAAPVPAQPTGEEREAERGLRGLVGAGSSQVSVTAAMRARDAARPSAEEVARAEAELVIVRRGWVPRDPLTR